MGGMNVLSEENYITARRLIYMTAVLDPDPLHRRLPPLHRCRASTVQIQTLLDPLIALTQLIHRAMFFKFRDSVAVIRLSVPHLGQRHRYLANQGTFDTERNHCRGPLAITLLVCRFHPTPLSSSVNQQDGFGTLSPIPVAQEAVHHGVRLGKFTITTSESVVQTQSRRFFATLRFLIRVVLTMSVAAIAVRRRS